MKLQPETPWQAMRRSWNSLAADLYKTMLGLVLLTSLTVFVVLSYAWSAFLDEVQRQTQELLTAQFQLSPSQLEPLLTQARQLSETSLNVDQIRSLFVFGLVLLFTVLSLLAWWSARRFARPLTHLSAAANQLASGDFTARALLSRSLTRRSDETARLLKDFNVMAASLERLERERRYSVAAIAHELRTPVTVLRGRLEGVRDGVLPANPQELEKLIGHADLLSKLIEDLQLLSLAEAGELRLELGPVEVQDVLIRLHADHLPTAQAQGVDLLLELCAEPVRVTGDRRRLQQVVHNLLTNALRHTPPHGTVWIKLEVEAGAVHIEIHNTGTGFTAEALNRAFERFYSGPDRERGRGGSGLGLAISKSLIEVHGGSMRLFNTETGAGVQITLNPLAGDEGLPGARPRF
ncbi:sensor histidine kinase [Deinococcus peraridilitoris]|uniref:Signal transduction histidine-protein kinase/phosphatase MprB n=1 Tax=Deinococcus peraridilitoris (strain DSM 19664 / LMG 22246 / CIP 109416 / KR-200) TaxID=937777 RepID=K9ZYC5_DEIPD|nr:ATP-binding protein [Deinococcus peraridilitoris]AFZ65942.1 signal transduction histidine kinase [Deinococcus peraridilitoris DSM 19664]